MAFRPAWKSKPSRSTANCAVAREATAAADGSGSRPTRSRSSAASGTATTLGSPIALQVVNKDYKLERLDDLPRPRPGHGDLTGAIKYLGSIRGVLERASARETAVRVAAGALAKQLLAPFGITAFGYVVELGGRADRAASRARWTSSEACATRAKSIRSIPAQDDADQAADRRQAAKKATRWAASSKCASRGCRSAWARTPSGTASSTAGWRRP